MLAERLGVTRTEYAAMFLAGQKEIGINQTNERLSHFDNGIKAQTVAWGKKFLHSTVSTVSF